MRPRPGRPWSADPPRIVPLRVAPAGPLVYQPPLRRSPQGLARSSRRVRLRWFTCSHGRGAPWCPLRGPCFDPCPPADPPDPAALRVRRLRKLRNRTPSVAPRRAAASRQRQPYRRDRRALPPTRTSPPSWPPLSSSRRFQTGAPATLAGRRQIGADPADRDRAKLPLGLPTSGGAGMQAAERLDNRLARLRRRARIRPASRNRALSAETRRNGPRASRTRPLNASAPVLTPGRIGQHDHDGGGGCWAASVLRYATNGPEPPPTQGLFAVSVSRYASRARLSGPRRTKAACASGYRRDAQTDRRMERWMHPPSESLPPEGAFAPSGVLPPLASRPAAAGPQTRRVWRPAPVNP